MSPKEIYFNTEYIDDILNFLSNLINCILYLKRLH
jgi:hypothetical protein